MRIAIVCRELAEASAASSASATALWARCLVDELSREGHAVHIVTQALSREPAHEARGLVRWRRLALPTPITRWERITLDFAVMAGRAVRELHDRGEIDLVIAPSAEAPGVAIALANAFAAARPPLVVMSLDEGGGAGEGAPMAALAELLADGVAQDSASRGAVAEMFRSLSSRAGRRGAPERLAAWRRAQAAAAERMSQESFA